MIFPTLPRIVSEACIVSKAEGDGSLGACFDVVLEDDKLGEQSFERAECRMFENAIRLSCSKAGLSPSDVDVMLAGDLLNQLITANYGARELHIPYLGLYGACSTMAETLLLGSILIDGGYQSLVSCTACSHFSTAERQYRFPLEMGTSAPPTAQRTVTGAGSILLSHQSVPLPLFTHIGVSAGTIGRVIDLGVTDTNNMGAAMAPAACDTILAHLSDMGRSERDYDLIVTGDLGTFGSEMLLELLREHGLSDGLRHIDCGARIFHPKQGYLCGGSGCGCSAVVLCGWLLPKLERGELKRILFLATGALMSPTANQQGESIPAVAHAVVLEHLENGGACK